MAWLVSSVSLALPVHADVAPSSAATARATSPPRAEGDVPAAPANESEPQPTLASPTNTAEAAAEPSPALPTESSRPTPVAAPTEPAPDPGEPTSTAEDDLTSALPALPAGAPSESARLLSEAARALDTVERRHAELRSELAARRGEAHGREDRLLGILRRAREAQDGKLPARAVYQELESTLVRAQRALRSTFREKPPRAPGPPTFAAQGLLALEADTRLLDQRREAIEAARVLLDRDLALDRAARLGLLHRATVELNRARLALLPKVSATERSEFFGANLAALRRAGMELTEVELVLRFHWFIAASWVTERLEQRNVGATPTVELGVSALVLLLVVIVFVMAKSRFAATMTDLRARNAQSVRDLGRQAAARNARGLDLLEQTFSPAAWLVFILAVSALLPAPLREPLEMRLLVTTLLWWSAARLVVAGLDAVLTSGRGVHPEVATVRLRSLKLVVGTTVGIGLALSLSRHLVGEGTVHFWLRSVAWLVLVPSLLLLASWWRPLLAARLARSTRTRARERWLLRRLQGPVGLPFTALVALHLFGKRVSRWLRDQAESRMVARKVLAYLFQRELDKRGQDGDAKQLSPVPGSIWEVFDPSRREQANFDAPADDELSRVLGGQHRVVAYVGERGAGKSATLASALGDRARVVWVPGARTVNDLSQNLALAAELVPGSCSALARSLDARKESTVVVLDDVDELLQPRIGGIAPFDELMDSILPATEHVLWVLTFDESVWNFLEASRGAHPTFDAVVHARPWDEADIRALVRARLAGAGLSADFSLLVPALPPGTDEWELLEETDKAEGSFYRLLWDYSAGNPAVALHAFRSSLGLAADGTLHVRPFKPPKLAELEALSDSSALILRAAYVLGESTLDDVMALTLDSRRAVEQTLRHFEVRGILEARGGKNRITWGWYRATSTYLVRRHLISSRRGERFA